MTSSHSSPASDFVNNGSTGSLVQTLEVISIENIDRVKYLESQKIRFKKKLEIATKLKEYIYGRKATTGRVQRVFSAPTLFTFSFRKLLNFYL